MRKKDPPQVVRFPKVSRRQRASGIDEASLNDPIDDLFPKGRRVTRDPVSLGGVTQMPPRKATPTPDPWAAEEVTAEDAEAGDPHLLASPEAALRFMLAGNAIVTFRSRATDTRFTYRVRASEDGRVYFVALLGGPDNNSDYRYLGYIRRDAFFHGGAKAKVAYDASSAKAFKWVWEQLQRKIDTRKVLEIWHEGKCGRCGRRLTVPSSIASGIGPDCAEQMGM